MMCIIISLLYNHFHHFIDINDSDYSFLWLLAVVPDEPPSYEQQPLRDSSSFVVDEPTPLPHALCRPLAHAGRAQPRNDIDGHGIAVITAARRSNGPCRGRGGFADAGWQCGTACQCLALPAASGPPVGRSCPAGLPAVAGPPAAAAGPPDCQQCLPPVGRRRPARVERPFR